MVDDSCSNAVRVRVDGLVLQSLEVAIAYAAFAVDNQDRSSVLVTR